METIVLIHGAWSDASAWVLVEPLLKTKGYEVINLNLPGHGKDNAPFTDITLSSYVNAARKAIGDRKNVILVGHSMAGQILSQIGEDIPAQIKKLVYLAACLPEDGQSLIDLAKADVDGHTAKYLTVDEENHAAIISKDGVVELFFEDTPKDILQGVLAHWKTEPLAPLSQQPDTIKSGSHPEGCPCHSMNIAAPHAATASRKFNTSPPSLRASVPNVREF